MTNADEESPRVPIPMGDDLLSIHFNRESVEIARSFDQLHGDDVQEISDLYGHSLSILRLHLKDPSSRGDPLDETCGLLLWNTALSSAAALDLLRRGYRLQPGILVRNVIETLATVVHLRLKPYDLKPFREGALKSHTTVTTAKHLILDFGPLYGLLTKEFAHLGTLHAQPQLFTIYEAREPALQLNLKFVRTAVWLHYVVTEFVFVDLLTRPRYWRRTDPKRVSYAASVEELEWASKFLGRLVRQPPANSP